METRPQQLTYGRDALIVFMLLLAVYGYFYQDPGWNGNSRIGLTFAIVQEGRLTIDSFYKARNISTGDKSEYNGHFYSDKAIGSSALGALAYTPIYWGGLAIGQQPNMGLVKYLMTLLVIGVPSAYAGSLLYMLCLFASGSRWRAYIAALGIGLGTLALPYTIMFYGHQLAGALLLMAFFLIFRMKFAPVQCGKADLWLIGLLLGLGLITEYTTAVIVLPLVIYYFYVIWETGQIRRVMSFVAPALSGAVPVAMVLTYNTICFGGPLAIGYDYVTNDFFRESMQQGVQGVQWPQMKVLYYLTIHPAHGLFWQSPVLLMAVLGLGFMARERRYRFEAIMIASTFVVYLLVNSGYYMWWGGWASGPRHSIPVLPLLCLPLIFVPRRIFFLVAMLAVISIAQMVIVAASNAQAPDDQIKKLAKISFFKYSTIYSYCWRKLIEGQFAWNAAQQLFGLQGFASLAPLGVLFAAATGAMARIPPASAIASYKLKITH